MPRLRVPAFPRLVFAPIFVAVVMIAASALAFGQTESFLHDFISMPHGGTPEAPLVADAAGNFYGTTQYGGTYGFGTVFKLAPGTNGKWMQTVLYSFQGGYDGSNPIAGLIFDAAGNLYGTTSMGYEIYNYAYGCYDEACGTVFRLSPNSNGTWTETVLYAFGAPPDAAIPMGPVIFDKAGNLYGTTQYGGSAQYGTVFELTPTAQGPWTETILYNFTDDSDGGFPVAGLAFDTAGNLYGATPSGGDIDCNNDQGYQPYGCGTVYELAHNSDGSWSESVLHSFDTYDGAFPLGNIIFDSSGNIYGTTSSGPGLNCAVGCGTIFKMAPSNGTWTLTTVYTFAGGPDGETPVAGLVQGADGNFYGTTQNGASSTNCQYGCGSVFELTPTNGLAWKEKILHSFSGTASTPYGVDGNGPVSSLIFDQAGNLYGTASKGGSVAAGTQCVGINWCGGTIFKLTKNASGKWTTSMLYSFTSSGDALNPIGGLIADAAGNLYGATQYGGVYDFGSVYELTPQAGGTYTERVLYSFAGGTDGYNPSGRLVFDTAGNLYGATYYGGVNSECTATSIGCGTVYELSPGTGGKWTEKLIHTFTGTDGTQANSSLVFDSAGNLYGTTVEGGSSSVGTAYELSPAGGNWTISVLHNFSGTDGYYPGPVVFDTLGNLYGTAEGGTTGSGVVFELSKGSSGWTDTVLHNFTTKTDGFYPAGVAFLKSGALVGVTYEGGNYTNCYSGCGAVFEVSQVGGSWQKRNLYTFAGGTDGANPLTIPIVDGEGNIYGTTAYGGAACPTGSDSVVGCGTIYKLTPSSGTSTDTIVYSFGSTAHDVYYPSQLLLSSSNILYGTGEGGDDGNGAVFQVDLNQAARQDAAIGKKASRLQLPSGTPVGGIRSPFSQPTHSSTSGKGGN